MTQDDATHASGRLRRVALVAALAAATALCLVMWADASDSGSAAVRPGGSPAPTPATPTVAAQVVAGVPASPALPVTLTIPSIDVRTSLIRLGQHADGTVEVPADPDRAGWFDLGPPPGTAGSSVILGHVDSTSGPAVFYRLKELRPGDRIAVRLDDDTTVEFRVHSVATYANADFPARRVYGKQGRSQLNLVTCGGAYDASRGGYQANVVVNARLAG